MKTFLHLAVNPTSPELRESVEEKLNKAADWLRYNPNCWLIYTSQPAKVWYERLSEISDIKDGSLFICEINIRNRAGWLKTSLWDWIKQERE